MCIQRQWPSTTRQAAHTLGLLVVCVHRRSLFSEVFSETTDLFSEQHQTQTALVTFPTGLDTTHPSTIQHTSMSTSWTLCVTPQYSKFADLLVRCSSMGYHALRLQPLVVQPARKLRRGDASAPSGHQAGSAMIIETTRHGIACAGLQLSSPRIFLKLSSFCRSAPPASSLLHGGYHPACISDHTEVEKINIRKQQSGALREASDRHSPTEHART